MKDVGKLLLIGVVSTVIRIIAQLQMPVAAEQQTVLQPSLFVLYGTMPLVFTIYGVVTYSLLAGLFLLIREKMSGQKWRQGLVFGLALSVIWSIYLTEPLPHTQAIDAIIYPLADSAALLVMGLLAGLLFGKADKSFSKFSLQLNSPMIRSIVVAFVIGRLYQYVDLKIYSNFDVNPWASLLWAVATGYVTGVALNWFATKLAFPKGKQRGLWLSLGIFGINLIIFNFYMPLVFASPMLDLILRTLVDIVAVMAGVLVAEMWTKSTLSNMAQAIKSRLPK